MICRNCGREMNNILHFESDREYQYNTCKHCRDNTKRKRIHYDELEKGRKHEYRRN